ncbi:MAG: hypothetical protein ACWA5X_00170 [bacterium]
MDLRHLMGAVIIVSGLAGCGSDGPGIDGITDDSPTSAFPLPERIHLRQLPPEASVSATATIKELGQEIPLQIGSESATGSFDSLPAGSYTVLIKFVHDDSQVTLAQSEQRVDYGGSTQSVFFSKDAYIYPDDDGDLFSNLDELLVYRSPTHASDVPVPRRVFITSVSGNGDLSSWPEAAGATGIEAGDNVCQARADQAGLSGTYRAWLSDHNHDAYCRVAGKTGKRGSSTCDVEGLDLGSYVRTDGFPLANSLDEIINNSNMLTGIKFDEYGDDIFGGLTHPWTATDETGRFTDDTLDRSSYGSCFNWTSAEADSHAAKGNAYATREAWTRDYKGNCNEDGRLYCFQASAADPVLPLYKQSAAKKVFVTSVEGPGDLRSWTQAGGNPSGIGSGDAICQTLASEAGLENASKFKAWLSSVDVDAIDRLFSNGPWARLDGVLVASSKASLPSTGNLFTSISQTEKGDYVTSHVWSGSNKSGRYDDETLTPSCGAWRSSSSSDSGGAGRTKSMDVFWNLGFVDSCNEQLPLYCFEDL